MGTSKSSAAVLMIAVLTLALAVAGLVSRPAAALITIEIEAGVDDLFAAPPDPAVPSAELLSVTSRVFQDFDLTGGLNGGSQNTSIAHTFSDLPLVISGATLELRVRGGAGGGVPTDGLKLAFADGSVALEPDAVVFARSFGPSPGLPLWPEPDPTGLVGSWSEGQEALITLDLGALPLPSGGTLDLLAEIGFWGFLDVVVIDDTGVDFMRLTIDYFPECSDGEDNDGDGLFDYPDDPGCYDANDDLEDPFCQDGDDNDGDTLIDFDGGQSIHGACSGGTCPPGVSDPDADGVADPDPQCKYAWRDSEVPRRCGVGVELVLTLPALMWLHRRRAARRA